MTQVKVAECIVRQDGSCRGIACSECPSNAHAYVCLVTESGMNHRAWFQKWMVEQIAKTGACSGICSMCSLDYCGVGGWGVDKERAHVAREWLNSKGGNMNDVAMEKIIAMEKELEILKAKMDASQKIELDMVFDPLKSYVAIDEDGDCYYLVANVDNAKAYSWHNLSRSPSITWDGQHEFGQEALESLMNEDIYSPWTIHEFNSGVAAMEFYLDSLNNKEA